MSFGQKKNTVSLEIYVFTITNLQLIGWYRPLEKKEYSKSRDYVFTITIDRLWLMYNIIKLYPW